jgi:hypothetical protein
MALSYLAVFYLIPLEVILYLVIGVVVVSCSSSVYLHGSIIDIKHLD